MDLSSGVPILAISDPYACPDTSKQMRFFGDSCGWISPFWEGAGEDFQPQVDGFEFLGAFEMNGPVRK
jgi:hypothetical protein